MGKATTFLSTPSARRATQPYVPQAGQNPISIHALREEGDFVCHALHLRTNGFLSTPSARRATWRADILRRNWRISIHALREEGDLDAVQWRCAHLHFYPRPPRGGRPRPCRPSSARREYFYPRPPRGGRQRGQQCGQCPYRISIHALREEGDPALLLVSSLMIYFYPRPPRGGRRFASFGGNLVDQFLSTPSARRATVMYSNPSEGHTISIHALREEGDSRPNCRKPALSRFLSTPSARRATTTFNYPRIIEKFLSTPSARRATESAILVDLLVQFLSTPSARRATRSGRCLRGSWSYFYPRPPRGGRRPEPLLDYPVKIFLSTPSARRATHSDQRKGQVRSISIHALREEGDLRQPQCRSAYPYFYPRPPRGGRRCPRPQQSWR